MQKISSSTATANGAGEFTQGQPGSGIDATMITVAWLNAIQRELVNLVKGSGQDLKPEDDEQVLKSVKMLQELASTWDKITGKPTSRDGYKLSDVFTKTETGSAIQDSISGLMPKAGGAYNPSFSGASFNAEARGYNSAGGYIGWGSVNSGTMQFFCNRGKGSAGGFVWVSVSADNQSLGPGMTYSPDGVLAVPNSLSVPAIQGSTTVSTQPQGSTSGFIANCAFVATAASNAVSNRMLSDFASTAGFANNNAAQPYMRHTSTGTNVLLKTTASTDTALLSATGWSKNADTGEIKQWFEYNQGDVPGTSVINITWPFQFPNQFLNARFSFKMPNGTTPCAIQASYSGATISGCTVRLEEWGNVAQAGLVLVIEARGN